jgi:hypothetical protein
MQDRQMNIPFLLMALHDGVPVLPIEIVCRDYFSHLTPQQFVRKSTEGEIDLPVIRIERSQKAARGAHLQDLAAWIDRRRQEAQRECDQLQGRR